jgi:hypothetical protein
MPDLHTYDYAIVRVVPRVERGEFVNAGVIVCCAPQNFLRALVDLDEARVRALDPTLEIEAIRSALAAIPAICVGGEKAGALGQLSLRERFDWLVAPRSTSIQMSPVHTGRACDLDKATERLLDTLVRPNGETG